MTHHRNWAFSGQLTLKTDGLEKLPELSGTAVDGDKYRFWQLHFHWHFDNDKGSEHALDGQRYALEVRQQMFYN